MANPQTSVASAMTARLAGDLSDSFSLANSRKESRTSEEASAGIPFGIMVKEGTAAGLAKLCTGTTNVLAGIVVRSNSFAIPDELVVATGLTPKTTFSAVTKGEINVLLEENVTLGSDVRVRMVAGGGEQAGAFRTTADSTDCLDLTALARWLTAGSSGDTAVLQIDLSNVGLAVADT